MRPSKGEVLFALQCRVYKLDPVAEFRFHPVRKFRADFYFAEKKLLVEIEGGTWSNNSRHTRGSGYQADCEKYNLATKMGYRILRFTTDMVSSGEAIKTVREMIECQ